VEVLNFRQWGQDVRQIQIRWIVHASTDYPASPVWPIRAFP
jgi:hypothetical protein